MNRTVAAWLRAIAAFIPSGVGTALSVGAWLALTALFTLVGNAVILGVVTAMGQSLGLALVLLTVVAVFGIPAVSLSLARVVVAAAIQRVEAAIVASGDTVPAGDGLESCESNERVACQTACC
jgi:uncharacterized RDD family membrane protein YckC